MCVMGEEVIFKKMQVVKYNWTLNSIKSESRKQVTEKWSLSADDSSAVRTK